MKKTFAQKALVALALLLSFTTAAFADIPAPQYRETPRPPQNETTARMMILVRSDAKEPTLVIKRGALKNLRAALDEAEAADGESARAENRFNFSRAQTVIGGALFSTAFLVGGVWAFRKPGKGAKIALSALVLAALGGGALLVSANSPPPQVVSLTSRIFDKSTKAYGYASGPVKIKITDDAEQRYDVIFEVPTAESDKRTE